jgi:hypothetical protein
MFERYKMTLLNTAASLKIQKLKLLDQLRDVIQLRHYSIRTEKRWAAVK